MRAACVARPLWRRTVARPPPRGGAAAAWPGRLVNSAAAAAEEGIANNGKRSRPPSKPLAYSDPGAVLGVASELSKARLSGFVAITAFAGYAATGLPLATFECAAATTGTFLLSGAANALNQYREVDRDSKMMRTVGRPLPMGRCSPNEAVGFAALAATAGTGMLAACSPVAAGLGAGNLVLYSGAYTRLKPMSEWNTWVGAVVGGVPPLIGWAAAGLDVTASPEPWLLAGALYLWQFPHFFALSWVHRVDYGRGGFAMVPVNDPTGDRTSRLVLNYSLYATALPFAAVALEATSPMFALEGAALNAALLYYAFRFRRDRSTANARSVFRITLAYLPLLLFFFVLHSYRLKESSDESNPLDQTLENWLRPLRAAGKAACVHEVFASDRLMLKQTRPDEPLPEAPLCPVTSPIADKKRPPPH